MMMKHFFTVATFAVAVGFTSQASAGLLLEPYLGYESSTQDYKQGAIDNGGTTTGLLAGLRAGYKLPLMLWFALDYSMMSGGTGKPSGAGNDYKVDSSHLYFDVGFDLPVLARVWAGVGVQNKAIEKYTASEATFTFNSPIKIGVGFTALPFVSINIEYFMMKLKEVESNGITASNFDKNDNTGAIVSVSLPFNL
jgi:hypothetical protein